MARFGAVGGSYQSAAQSADAQACRNFYVEKVESEAGNASLVLLRTPGLKSFSTTADSPGRGTFTLNQRVGGIATATRTFAVTGGTLFEIASDGTPTSRGAVANDGLPVSFAASSTQLLIASGGRGYVLTLATNVLTPDPDGLVTPLIVAYADGYFVSLQKNSANFQISTALGATTWSGLNVSGVSVFSDNVMSMIIDHREIWLFGTTKTVVYFDSGNTFPFDVIPSAFLEQGCVAQFSPAKLDNTVFWLGGDERGSGIVWKASGYSPVRVSTHAIEYAWAQYSKISDAIGFAYQEEGHTFYQLYFPTANKTWVFDAATGLWHERDRLVGGQYIAHPAMSHTFAFGKHLICDSQSGKIYQQSRSLLDDDGSPIRRVRRAPYINNELKRIYHNELELFLKTGIGTSPPLLDGAGVGRGPQVMMRYSDDGANNWSNEYVRDAGQIGEYKKRVRWVRLGQSRNRVYEFAVTDAVDWQFVDAYLDASPGYQTTERISDKLRKMA